MRGQLRRDAPVKLSVYTDCHQELTVQSELFATACLQGGQALGAVVERIRKLLESRIKMSACLRWNGTCFTLRPGTVDIRFQSHSTRFFSNITLTLTLKLRSVPPLSRSRERPVCRSMLKRFRFDSLFPVHCPSALPAPTKFEGCGFPQPSNLFLSDI